MTEITQKVTIKGLNQVKALGESYESIGQQLTEATKAVEANRNVNKSRAGLNIRIIRGTKAFADRLGKTASGLVGERGIKLRGIVGATAGLLAFDKLAETVKKVFQGQQLKDAVAFQLKEIIPPLLRETIPAILNEDARRRKLIADSEREALQLDRDLEKRLLKQPSLRKLAATTLGESVDREPKTQAESDRARLARGVQADF